MGDHKHHYKHVQPVAEGVMGGAQCHCKGECRDGRYRPKDIDRIVDMFTRAQRNK